MWWAIPISVGVGTGVGVGLKGGSPKEAFAWSVLTSSLSYALGSGRFWRGAWGGARWAAPYAWGATRVVAKDVGIIARAALGTSTVTGIAAVAAGYTIGAVTGTVIVSQAEKRGMVYEGATADVLDFYTGSGQYWGDYDWKGTPTTEEPSRPGYFNVPGNVRVIASTYWNRWTD